MVVFEARNRCQWTHPVLSEGGRGGGADCPGMNAEVVAVGVRNETIGPWRTTVEVKIGARDLEVLGPFEHR
jgi:hypothetical protein